jgi:uncharacterized protein (DUF305 family)
MRPCFLIIAVTASLVLAGMLSADAQPAAPEKAFLAQNQAAMDKMMQAMSAPPTGDIDRDFVAMMEPHHQGGIDMAVLLLRYGKNENLKRLAQEIIVTQQQEIAAMRLAVGAPLPTPKPSPTSRAMAMDMKMAPEIKP